MKIDLAKEGYAKIWQLLVDKPNFKRDKFLSDHLGLERIEKTRGRNYFICSFRTVYKKNDDHYKLFTNLKVIDKKKWFLSRLKYEI